MAEPQQPGADGRAVAADGDVEHHGVMMETGVAAPRTTQRRQQQPHAGWGKKTGRYFEALNDAIDGYDDMEQIRAKVAGGVPTDEAAGEGGGAPVTIAVRGSLAVNVIITAVKF
eukprot:gene37593-18345_t